MHTQSKVHTQHKPRCNMQYISRDAAKAQRRRTYFLGAVGATAGRGGRPAGDSLALVSSSASLESSSESLGGSKPAVAGCRTTQSFLAAACDAALYR